LGKNFGKVAAARYSFGLVIADACGSRPLMDISILVGIPVGVVRDMRAGKASYANREQHELLARRLKESGLLSQGKFDALNGLSTYLSALKNTDKVKWGIDEIVKFRDAIPEAFKSQTDFYINGMILKGILSAKSKMSKEDPSNTALKELTDYIKTKLPEADKKGF
jgi:hypothetical protein